MRNWKTAVAAAALILGAGLVAPFSAIAQTEATAEADARQLLPNNARPERYGITLTPDVAAPFRSADSSNYGVGVQFGLGRGLQLNGFVVGSSTDNQLLAPGAGDGSGA